MRAEDKTKKLERCDNVVVDQLKWEPGGPCRKIFEILHCCRWILAQVWRKKIDLMSSAKATAASRSGEMIYYEPLGLYAFNFSFCVEILLWILASELRIQL